MRNNHYKVVVVIVDREKKREVAKLIDLVKHSFQFVTIGRGTANAELLDMLGLGSTEKAVLLAVMDEVHIEELFHKLREELEFDEPGHGVAFSIPLESVCGKRAFALLTGDPWEVSL